MDASRESSPERDMSAAERKQRDEDELKLKQEVIDLGPTGPISKAARDWLHRNKAVADALLEKLGATPDLVTPEQRRERVEQALKWRQVGLDKEAARRAKRAAEKLTRTD
ncbi:hypothetical protein B0H11DRAFT_1946399 [Mycena galericulata]|nr:hypothetical protein B0H11DRAFT_1946399 [Mycena galericulata]